MSHISNVGVGIGLITGLLPVIISEYFDKDSRAGAVGLSYSGAAVGAFIFPLIFESLISSFQLQPSLLIMGGITLLAIIGALSLTPIEEAQKLDEMARRRRTITNSSVRNSMEEENGEYQETATMTEVSSSEVLSSTQIHECEEGKIDENENILYKIKDHIIQDLRLVTNLYFILVTLVYIAYIMGNVTFLMILPDFAMEVGLSKSQGIFLLSIFSVTDLIGRMTPLVLNYFGTKANKSVINNKFMYVTSISMLSIILFIFPLLGNSSLSVVRSIKSIIPLYFLFLTLILIAGFFSGFQMILPPVLLSEYLGPQQTAVAFGLSNFICGLVSFTRPFIIDVIRDQTNSYDMIFYIFASIAALTSIFWLLEIFWTCSRKYNEIKNKS